MINFGDVKGPMGIHKKVNGPDYLESIKTPLKLTVFTFLR